MIRRARRVRGTVCDAESTVDVVATGDTGVADAVETVGVLACEREQPRSALELVDTRGRRLLEPRRGRLLEPRCRWLLATRRGGLLDTGCGRLLDTERRRLRNLRRDGLIETRCDGSVDGGRCGLIDAGASGGRATAARRCSRRGGGGKRNCRIGGLRDVKRLVPLVGDRREDDCRLGIRLDLRGDRGLRLGDDHGLDHAR